MLLVLRQASLEMHDHILAQQFMRPLRDLVVPGRVGGRALADNSRVDPLFSVTRLPKISPVVSAYGAAPIISAAGVLKFHYHPPLPRSSWRFLALEELPPH